jgi:hypothetical protein
VDQWWLLEAIEPAETVQRRRLILLHRIRVAGIARICLLATEIPNFNPQLGVIRDDILARILELDVPSAVERLRLIFSHDDNVGDTGNDFGGNWNTGPSRRCRKRSSMRRCRSDAEAV